MFAFVNKRRRKDDLTAYRPAWQTRAVIMASLFILGVIVGHWAAAEETAIIGTGVVTVKDRTIAITVDSARKQDGIGLPKLGSRYLKVVGPRAATIERFRNKEIEFRGGVDLEEAREINVTSVSDKKMRELSHPPSADPQRTIGARGKPLTARNSPEEPDDPLSVGNGHGKSRAIGRAPAGSPPGTPSVLDKVQLRGNSDGTAPTERGALGAVGSVSDRKNKEERESKHVNGLYRGVTNTNKSE